MSNPTTPFSWQMPTATDLVTDLPADFEVFGQAVATSMADLLGGTSGQILAKNSNTDMDFVWVTNDVGDITAVTAGTGITGGGTSGAVTITNDMATTITAAGDIVVGTGSGTYDNLPIGTTAQVLTADTTVSPYKVKWAAVPASTPSFVGNRNVKTSSQSIANGTFTAVTFDTETYDTDGFHSTVSNTSRITIPAGKGGYYKVFGVANFAANGSGARIFSIYKNGTTDLFKLILFGNGSAQTGATFSDVVNLVATDYIEMRVYQSSGGALDLQGTSSDAGNSAFGVAFMGA
jgi:hypothetical protein